MAVNLGLHLAASGLVLYLAGPVAASLFAAHPMAADAVASVSGRSAELLALSVLIGIAVYRRSKLAGAIVGAVAAVGSAAFTVGYFATIHGAPGRWDYMRSLAASFPDILRKTAIPVGLSAEPVMAARGGGLEVLGWMLVAALVALIFAKRIPSGVRIGAGLLILPLLPYFLIPLPNGFYEHRAYLSLAGASILMAAALSKLPGAALVIATAFLVMTDARVSAYASPVALWEDAVAKTPMNGRAHLNLGTYYALAGRINEAQQEYETVIRIAPDIALGWKNLSNLHLWRGRVGSASEVLDAFDEYVKSKQKGRT